MPLGESAKDVEGDRESLPFTAPRKERVILIEILGLRRGSKSPLSSAGNAVYRCVCAVMACKCDSWGRWKLLVDVVRRGRR